MRFLKYILIVLLAILIGRELVGLFQWFVIEGKTWAELRAMTKQDVKDELTVEFDGYKKFARKVI